MSEKKRPKYTKEFKQDAIKLVIEQQYSCPDVGRRLGVAASNISRWESWRKIGNGSLSQTSPGNRRHEKQPL